jgi:cytidylate kinase
MIVTIDGPAGAGKSSAARRLARRLGFRFLDTGAMYRAVTLAGLRQGVDWGRPKELAAVAAELVLEVTDDRVLMNGEDVTAAIRTLEITSLTQHAADNEAVRRLLIARQRAIAADANVVTEGRDQATVVFPHAECKIFLTAGEEERARRRFQDLSARGEEVNLAVVLEKQRQRDRRDVERPFGGLAKAPDSIEVNTDGMTPEEVVDRLEEIVRGVHARRS